MRKARRLGLNSVFDMMQLAAQRGCQHYANQTHLSKEIKIDRRKLTDNELVILLLHGNNLYEPNAVRCAAQLLKSTFVDAEKVSELAIRERVVKQLSYIAKIGEKYDAAGSKFWQQILKKLTIGKESNIPDCVLPHRSRFMIDPGIQRGKKIPPFWLNPSDSR